MLPVERQKRIKELIQKNHHMKISELSKVLSVSEMTIHRDVKTLVDEGLIQKTFGGITLIHNAEQQATGNSCIICGNDVNDRLAYRIIFPDSTIETACCVHCGLLRQNQLGDQTVQAICFDFLTHTTISTSMCWYVTDTSIHIGCCQPQMLPFEYKEHAENFVKGFGGRVLSFEEALQVTNEKVNENPTNCQHKE